MKKSILALTLIASKHNLISCNKSNQIWGIDNIPKSPTKGSQKEDEDDIINSEISIRTTNNEVIPSGNTITSALAMLLKNQLSSDRIIFLTRIGLVYFLTTELWKSFKIAWEEWVDGMELNNNLYEDHDQPFFKPGSLLNGTESVDDKRSRRKVNVGISSYARDLAVRLHSCGIEDNKVYTVLSSLTKIEGQLLSNCLVSPQPHDTLVWNNIAGLSNVQESLMDILYSFLHPPPPDYSTILSSTATNGILLYGPPGTGKSMLAKALAQSTNIRFLAISPSSLLRKYVGETNLYIRALFSLANKLQPCIIFIDEMDGLFRERALENEHDVSRDLKTEFMSLWDGIRTTQDKILILGATNRPFDIDVAFLRRMSRSFFITLPDVNARIEFLQLVLKSVPLEDNFDYGYVAGMLDGYSPSDMKQVLHTAAMIPLREARNLVRNPHSTLPPLRKLVVKDVIRAKEVVPPTQWSKNYRMLLAEYANRVSSGIAPYKELQDERYTSMDQYTASQEEDGSTYDSSGYTDYDTDEEELHNDHNDDDDDTDDYLF